MPPNQYERTVGWFKGHKLTAILMVTASCVITLAALTDALPKLRRITDFNFGDAIEIGIASYLYEVAVSGSRPNQSIYEESRDASTNCRLRIVTIPFAIGQALSPLPRGAHAEFQLKVRLRNRTNEKLTHIQMGFAPSMSFEKIERARSTPNVTVELSNPSRRVYVANISSLDPNEVAVITFVAPITRKIVDQTLGQNFVLNPLFLKTDQVHKNQMDSVSILDASTLLFDESVLFAGHKSMPVDISFKVFRSGDEDAFADSRILPPSYDCLNGIKLR